MERNSTLEHLWNPAMPKKKSGLIRRTDPKPMSKQQAIAQDNRDKGKTSLRKANEVPGAASKKSINRMQEGGIVSRIGKQFQADAIANPGMKGDARAKYYSQRLDSLNFGAKNVGVLNELKNRQVYHDDPERLADSLLTSKNKSTWSAFATPAEQRKKLGESQYADWTALQGSLPKDRVSKNMYMTKDSVESVRAGTISKDPALWGVRSSISMPDATRNMWEKGNGLMTRYTAKKTYNPNNKTAQYADTASITEQFKPKLW
jgi:hypothetical protein